MKLAQAADLLEQQGANPFRVTAYRRASETVSRLKEDIDQISILINGSPMAEQINELLHIDTLEALEAAAWDGRLEQVPGMGTRRVAGIRNSLSTLLGRSRSQAHGVAGNGPDVETLIEVDREYRQQAEQGRLPVIAPRRFNPEGKAWLPVLHTGRDGWHFTLLYSNTARAHELKRTRDWVVVYFYDDHHQEGQVTLVTETRGPLAGKRIVRGRELECRNYYRAAERA